MAGHAVKRIDEIETVCRGGCKRASAKLGEPDPMAGWPCGELARNEEAP